MFPQSSLKPRHVRGFLLLCVSAGTEQVGKCRVGQLVISAVLAPHPVQMTNPGPSVEWPPGGSGRLQSD